MFCIKEQHGDEPYTLCREFEFHDRVSAINEMLEHAKEYAAKHVFQDPDYLPEDDSDWPHQDLIPPIVHRGLLAWVILPEPLESQYANDGAKDYHLFEVGGNDYAGDSPPEVHQATPGARSSHE